MAEDDAVVRRMLESLLKSSGFQVAAAADGLEAMAMLESGPVDLLLLDMMMPGLSGLEVLKLARGKGYDLPVVALTALDSPDDIAKALELGADDYVVKPFSPVVLLARLKLRLKPRERAPERPERATPPPPPPESDGLLVSSSGVHAVDEPAPQTFVPDEPSDPGLVAAFMKRLRRAAKRDETTTGLPPLTEGTLLASRYRVGKVLGRGSFGVVHEARHVELEMDVAVKVLEGDVDQVVDGVSLFDRFRKEAMRACRVRHEHAVRVLDFGVADERRPYLVMELLRGPTLFGRLQRGPLAAWQAAATGAGVLAALGAAHREGIVHQDVKAANVILAEGPDGPPVPKLIDFGAAAEAKDRKSELVLGTASHMAPERFLGGACDAKGDVYAAGVMLYQALTGRLPFVHGDVEELAKLHATASPEKPSHVRPGLEPKWDWALEKLLAKRPADRPSAVEAASLVRGLA